MAKFNTIQYAQLLHPMKKASSTVTMRVKGMFSWDQEIIAHTRKNGGRPRCCGWVREKEASLKEKLALLSIETGETSS